MPPPASLDLQPLWRSVQPDGAEGSALDHPWPPLHRPDWVARGLIVWPRGGLEQRLRLTLACPAPLRALGPEAVQARLALRWWADRAELWVDGCRVHSGDLFDTACRWRLPARWWQGERLELELRLRSPCHDDGALIHSRVDWEPCDPADPHGLLEPLNQELRLLRRQQGRPETAGPGRLQILGHAHLDLAWLWPVADTWQAAERTFASALALMERFPDLHFGHSTPALYAWLEQHRPALFARIRRAMRAGRWEPLNGPWVESDCVLIGTPSLLRQFQEGQLYSRRAFPEWRHDLAWLPDSFGFAAGLPAVAAATGVRWFCTHKLAWNASQPFPHRLFRWRSRCGAELLALMTAPIGTDGDPLAIERWRLEWQRVSGCQDALWLPGVGDHGGGPTAEMLEQLALWQQQPLAAAQQHGCLRDHLRALEPLAPGLPVWRDELYLELHRGCATSRPDQKRHNRSLERLLREADLAEVLAGAAGAAGVAGAGSDSGGPSTGAGGDAASEGWRTLLFQQFHDILPGTSIPEVFAQAEPLWRAARRQACRRRDRALAAALKAGLEQAGPDRGAARARNPRQASLWWAAQLDPLPAAPITLRLPEGAWSLRCGPGDAGPGRPLLSQSASGGGEWLQLPGPAGVGALLLERRPAAAAPQAAGAPAAEPRPAADAEPLALQHPVRISADADAPPGSWRLENGLLAVSLGPQGLQQLWDDAGHPLLSAPLAWRRWRDAGEFWDAWDIAADHRDHPLPWTWQQQPAWLERGPLCAHLRWRGRCGTSALRLDVRLLAGTPWLELVLSLDWRQRHELLRLEIPLAQPLCRWAADTGGGVIERPAAALTPREQARWEVSAISWLASVGAGPGAGLAVLLDGPQGVSAAPERLGVSLLRAPTWPDPGADNGWQRQRLALMPCPRGWRAAAIPVQARRFRQPLWLRPAARAPAPAAAAAAPAQSPAQAGLRLPPLPPDLQLISLRRHEGTAAAALLAVQNLGPCRRRLPELPGWRIGPRLDGLGEPIESPPDAGDPLQLEPWQLGFWRLTPLR